MDPLALGGQRAQAGSDTRAFFLLAGNACAVKWATTAIICVFACFRIDRGPVMNTSSFPVDEMGTPPC
eukprot:4148703-Pyramimonas_sp.AAC.1